MDKKKFITTLQRQTQAGNYLLGVETATGISARCAVDGGADFILALNSGKLRQMGRSPIGSFLPFKNSNQHTLEFSDSEIHPITGYTPLMLGVNATDPILKMDEFLNKLQVKGYTGVANYPTVSLIDGNFRKALEENGLGYALELNLIREANKKGLVTFGFATDLLSALQMNEAKADIICLHLGLAANEETIAKHRDSLEHILELVRSVSVELKKRKSQSILMIYGGPINSVTEVRYLHNHVASLSGFVGGANFEQLGTTDQFMKRIQDFKRADRTHNDDLTAEMLEGASQYDDPVDFVRRYVQENYSLSIHMRELAKLAHLSPCYLSVLFKRKMGITFTDYLVKYRINKAVELMRHEELQLTEIATMVGYTDYAQFNKIFRKHMDIAPKKYRQTKIQIVS